MCPWVYCMSRPFNKRWYRYFYSPNLSLLDQWYFSVENDMGMFTMAFVPEVIQYKQQIRIITLINLRPRLYIIHKTYLSTSPSQSLHWIEKETEKYHWSKRERSLTQKEYIVDLQGRDHWSKRDRSLTQKGYIVDLQGRDHWSKRDRSLIFLLCQWSIPFRSVISPLKINNIFLLCQWSLPCRSTHRHKRDISLIYKGEITDLKGFDHRFTNVTFWVLRYVIFIIIYF
jgi:hypothetical protein